MSPPPVITLAQYAERVSDFRNLWQRNLQKELWFRGESKDYGETMLRPELYRPRTGESSNPLKPVSELSRIEWNLFGDFQRLAVQLSNEKREDENWDWDSYFLMQHHGGPTRLLDWSDGALAALHFAVRNADDDKYDAIVYVLEPYRLDETLAALPDRLNIKNQWKNSPTKCRLELKDDDWECAYLPADDETRSETPLPNPPLLLDFPHITRRVAAQRSRLMVFGADYTWLAREFRKVESPIQQITIHNDFRRGIRQQLRDAGITESVIFPDLDGLGKELKQFWEDLK